MSTYQRPVSVNLGSSSSGLAATLFYRVIDLDEGALIARTNSGVTEYPAGSGAYHVSGGAAWDDTWTGSIIWDETTLGLYSIEDFIGASGATIPGSSGSAYAVGGDVQAHIPTQAWELGVDSQPTTAQVLTWLEQTSRWVDGTLGWKYVVPVTDAEDVALLREIVAQLVAARVWRVLKGHDGEGSTTSKELRAEALASLSYIAQGTQAGRSFLVLSNTDLADSGEGARGQAVGSFTDPDDDESVDRFFKIDMSW